MVNQHFPVRLGPAEETLIQQLDLLGETATAERLRVVGLPTRRVESYHYTDLKLLLREVPPLAGRASAPGAAPLPLDGVHGIEIVNGVVGDIPPALDAVRFTRSRGPVLTDRDDVVAKLNSALVQERLGLGIDGVAGSVLRIDRRTEGEAAHTASAAQIFVADSARATLVEVISSSAEAHLANHASLVTLGKDAQFTHVVIDLSARPVSQFTTVEYQLGERARLRSLVIHAGAGLARTNVFARFAGEGAHADFSGLNLMDDGQHGDITLDVSHAVPNTTSKELFKAVARGRSKAVFQGRIVVARGAQKTDAKMMSQGLLLTDDAEILAKPELEIYADDVVCGHGATSGALDDEALFYLMSRGIPRPEAETILVNAFLAELIDPIEDEGVAAALRGLVDAWLAGGQARS